MWSRQPHTARSAWRAAASRLRLLAHDAPMTTWNFAQLANNHFFDGTTFMRVVPNFVIQGGRSAQRQWKEVPVYSDPR